MVHLHISGSVVQYLRIHVLLRVDIDLLIARGVIEFQFVKSAAFVGLRADGHLRFRARQGARRAVVLVVGAAHNNGLVRVAVQEIHYHFLTHARNGEVAKSGTGPRLGHPHPAGAVFVPRAVAVPVETYPHPAMLVAEDFLAGRTGDNGTLRAVHGGFGPRRGTPCPVSRDDVQVVTECGAVAGAAVLRLWLPSFQYRAGDLPFAVQRL
ncbi:hypothetical protein CIFRMA203M1_25035 [Citrobacter freundii]